MKNKFKLFSITAIAAVIVFSMTACASTGGGNSSAKKSASAQNDGVAKTLVVTGVSGFSGDVLVTIANDGRNLTGSMIAVGGSTISRQNNLSIPLVIPGRESDRWTGIGEYFIVLVFEQNGKVIYFYSQGGMSALRYNFTEATTTIPFDQFRRL